MTYIKLRSINFNAYNPVHRGQVAIFTCSTVCIQRIRTQADGLTMANTLQALDAKSYHYCHIHSTESN
jgi:hypothetical protein